MDITRVVAKMRLSYHMNMVDIVNVANQLKLMSDERANRANEKHLREIIDCWNRLGVPICKELIEFEKEGP